jgi:hypothetical protein
MDNQTMVPACYGYAIRGADCIPHLNWSAVNDLEPLEVVVFEVGSRRAESFGGDFARLVWEFGGTSEIDRRSRRVVLAGAPDGEYLTHPMLVGSTAVMAHWDGRVALHAAAVAIDGRALLLIGEKFAGKSTLVGALALAGHEVIADDISIATNGALTPGPRLVDLRPEAAALLGVVGQTTEVRGGANRRLAVGPARDTVRLAGIVSLEWGEPARLERLDARGRFELVVGALVLDARMVAPPPLLDLLALPAWRFVRARSGAGDLAESARRLALLASG